MEATETLLEALNTSLHEEALKKLNPEAFNAKTILGLLKILSKTAKPENKIKHVTCVLSCLEHFLNIDVDSLKWEQLGEDISKLCEAAFVISDTYVKNEPLIQKSLDIVSEILDHNNLAENMIRYMLKSILKSASSPNCSKYIRQSILNVSAALLQKSSRRVRSEILPSVTEYLEMISNYLLICGDFETQVAVVELLARSWIFIKDNQKVPALFSDCPKIFKMFNNYQFINFDPECRLFLNEVNEGMGDRRLVYSIPCMVVCADNVRLRKPMDLLYKEFWVDFNIILKSISFYYLHSDRDEWQLMTIAEESVVYAIAKDGRCKSRDGDVVQAVKIELTLKHDATKLDLPKVLKIYPRKTSTFAKLEKTVIKKILNDKYQSEVTYSDDVIQLGGDPGVEYVAPVPPARILKFKNTPVVGAEDSYFEMNTTLALQGCNECESEGSDAINPNSPSCVPALLHGQTKKTLQSDVQVSEEIPRESDSFIQYLDQLGHQESHTNIVINDSQIEDDEMLKNTDKGINVSNNMTVFNDALTVITNQNSPKANILTSVGEKSVSSPALLFSGELPVKNIKPIDSSFIATHTQTKNHKKDLPGLQCATSTSKKRRLYSRDNSDIKTVILSSQEEIIPEIPQYKIRKQELQIKRQQNVDRKNVSYSYIKYKENKSKGVADNNVILDNTEHQEQLYDVKTSQDKINNVQVSESPSNSLEYIPNSEKKLLALNKTPENTKGSNIFGSHTLFSDLTSSEKSSRFRKTYTRINKNKRCKRPRIKKLSSDSDSDYLPPGEKTPLPYKREKKAIMKSDVKGFVSRLPNKKIDPIRSIMTENYMELEPLNLDLEKSEIELKGISDEMPSKETLHPVRVNKKLRSKKDITNVESKQYDRKKPTNKIKKNEATQIKKLEGRKRQKTQATEKLIGDTVAEIPVILDLVNYEPPNANSDSDELALEIYTHPLSQNKVPVQTAYKINDMVQCGKYCLTQVNDKLQSIQSLAQKERDMNFAAFEFKTQASCSNVSTQCQKMEVVCNNLIKVRSMLESTLNIQNEIAAKIQAETVQLEEAKQELKNNMAKIGKSESSSIASIVQGPVRYMKNLVLSFVHKSTKKALPN